MADTPSTQLPAPDDLHWGVALRLDIQEIRQDIRELRKEASEFRKEMAQQFAEVRKEMAEQLSDIRKEVAEQLAEHRKETAQTLRHNLIAMLGFNGVLASVMIAFIQYRLGSP